MYYNLIDKLTHKFSGISSIETDGFFITDVPVKPLLYNQDEAIFNFNSNKWMYKFEEAPIAIDETQYSLINYHTSKMYINTIYPKNGNIVLEKSGDISVLIPCYNKYDYIVECVESCLNQTLSPKNIVVLLMDEKSIKLKDILQSLDQSVICIESERMNVCKARTTLVNKYCPTDWFIFLDADDTLSENCIEVLYKMDCSIAYPTVNNDDNGMEIADMIPTKYGFPSTSLTLNMTCLMNKQIFNEIGLDESLCDGGEDFDFNVRAFSDTNYKIGITYEAWYNYRTVFGGLSKKKEFFESFAKAVLKNLEFLHSEFVSYNGYNYIEDEFYKNPTIDELYKNIGGDLNIVIAEKRDLIKYKLYLSKYHDPITKYTDENFVYLNTDKKVEPYTLINKTFDVLFLENVNENNIFEDIPMIINKDILPNIEGMEGWNLLNYLVDNYACFDLYDINKIKTFEDIYEEMKASKNKNKVIQEQIRLLSLDKENVKDKSIKNDVPTRLSFFLHKRCNLKCEYCYQLGNEYSPLSDDEIYSNFDIALSMCEKKYKNIRVQLLGGEPTIWSDYLIKKLLKRLENYRTITIFSNGTNRDSLWYKCDKVIINKHVTDWEEHPENMLRRNLLPMEHPTIVITNNNIDLLEKYLEDIPLFRCFTPSPCSGSPDPSLDLSEENVERLARLISKYHLDIERDLCYSNMVIEIDCNNFTGKYCCKYPNSVIYTDIKEDHTQCEKCPLNKYRLYKEGNNNV
jgi:glycosyltransferase involved in cell wall biosynthesis/organic radical activating enzyme